VSRELVKAVGEIAQHFSRASYWVKTPTGPRHVKETPANYPHLERHCNSGPGIGLAPIAPGESTTRVANLDLDSHKGEVSWEEMIGVAKRVSAALARRGIEPIPFRSYGGKGIHLIMLWEEPQDAYSVRSMLSEVLAECGLKNGTKGVKHCEVEIFPKQDAVPIDGWGSMWILPLTGESVPLDRITWELQGCEVAEATDWPRSKPVPKLERPEPVQQHIGEISTDSAELRAQLQAIPNDAENSLDYDTWRNIVFAVHHATGGSDEGLSIVHEFSARSPKYDPEFLDERVWQYAKSERGGKVITARTIAAMARDNGWREDVLKDFEELPPEQETGSAGLGSAPDPTLDGPVPAGNRFRVLSEEEFAAQRASEWIVKNILPRAGLVLLIGQSTAGKSFIALDLAGSIARGEPWRGHKVKSGRVAIIAAEGAGGFRKRLAAYSQYHGIESTGIGVLPYTPDFLNKVDVKEVVLALKAFGRVDVIVIDTLAQVTPGGNENSSEDMGAALANCKAHRPLD
jgi:hypothetical protein